MDRESAIEKLIAVQFGQPAKEVLRELYVAQGLSIEKVGETLRSREVAISNFAVRAYLYKYGIEVRHFPTVAVPEPEEAGTSAQAHIRTSQKEALGGGR